MPGVAEYAQGFDVYVVASAKEKTPEYPARFFDAALVIDPDGEVIMNHRKLTPSLPVERSGRSTCGTTGSRNG